MEARAVVLVGPRKIEVPELPVPGLGSVDVIAASRAPGAGLGLVLPDVAEVVALGDGDDHGQ